MMVYVRFMIIYVFLKTCLVQRSKELLGTKAAQENGLRFRSHGESEATA